MNFRCLADASLTIPKSGLVFVGENAQGKTSLLEAVCVLTRLHSPRTRRHTQLVQFQQGQFGIAGQLWGQNRRIDFSKGSHRLRVDDEERKTQSAYLEDGGLVVWMGNEDRNLITGPAEGRRRYLDFIASQLYPNHRRALSRYRRILQARNALLRDGRGESAEMTSFTTLLIEAGNLVTAGRRQLCEALVHPINTAQDQVGASKESVQLEYRPGAGDDFTKALVTSQEAELRRGTTLVGPHRDDLKLRLNDLPAADFASEGQQRTLALALKLGQGILLQEQAGKTPIYLLDDIFGELDVGRRERLLANLPRPAQVLITTTNPSWLGHLSNLEIRTVKSGQVLD